VTQQQQAGGELSERLVAILARLREGDKDAMGAVLAATQGFRRRRARQFLKLGLPDAAIDDLDSEGAIAIMEAAPTFDPARGVSPLSYFSKPVLRAMQRWVTENARAMKLPIDILSSPQRVEKALRRADPATADGANTAARLRMASDAAMDAPVHGADGRPLGDTIADDAESSETAAVRAQEGVLVRRAVDRLPARERQVLLERADGVDLKAVGVTSAAGDRLHPTRVRQIEMKGKERLRELLPWAKPDPTAAKEEKRRKSAAAAMSQVIVALLAGPKTVRSLARLVGRSRPQVYQWLATMRTEGIPVEEVKSPAERKEGNCYRIRLAAERPILVEQESEGRRKRYASPGGDLLASAPRMTPAMGKKRIR